MKKIPMQFRFKGHRIYVHGSDMYDTMVNQIEELYTREALGTIRLTIHKPAFKQCDMVLGGPGEVPARPQRPIAEMVVKGIQGPISAWLVETDREVEGRYEYDEDRIGDLCTITGNRIIIADDSGFSSIEVAVAMTKRLHIRIFPDNEGKWFFTRLDLSRPLEAGDALQLAIEFNHSFEDNRLTKSAIFSADAPIGRIFFSAVKR